MGDTVTQGESVVETTAAGAPVPGLVVVFSAQTPMYRLLPLVPGINHVVGRDNLGGVTVPDERVSRQHAELCWGTDGVLTIRDLGSRNGVFIDGQRVEGTGRAGAGAVVRLAQTLLVVFDDLRRFYGGHIETSDGVVGPTLQQALDRAAGAARAATHLVGQGESGTGKERMALAFRAAVNPKAPFVAVNCLSIPPQLAASLFFGVVKGVATDVRQDRDGYLVAASGGVLFLDEIAELNLDIQGLLLRAVETGEVTPVGATTPTRISVRIVAASHRDLRQAVSEGRFRSDLYYRLNQSSVQVPPLRARKEELPWLMQHAVAGQGLTLHVSAVEAALLRPWPGNVRELLAATRQAASSALIDTTESAKDAVRLRQKHLSDEAGQPVTAAEGAAPRVRSAATAGDERPKPTREAVLEALKSSDGNVSAACRLLDIPPKNRTTLYRLMKDYGIARDVKDEEGAP